MQSFVSKLSNFYKNNYEIYNKKGPKKCKSARKYIIFQKQQRFQQRFCTSSKIFTQPSLPPTSKCKHFKLRILCKSYSNVMLGVGKSVDFVKVWIKYGEGLLPTGPPCIDQESSARRMEKKSFNRVFIVSLGQIGCPGILYHTKEQKKIHLVDLSKKFGWMI